MGNINFGDFLCGYFSTIPDLFSLPGRPFSESANTAFDDDGVDWDEEDGILRRMPCAPNLSDHPLLASAFASQPPVANMRIKLYDFADTIPLENEHGITVKDVIDVLRRWYDGPVEPKMAAMLSRHVEHHLPFLDPGTFGDFAVFVNREHMLQTLYSMQAAQGRLTYHGFHIDMQADGDVMLSMTAKWRYPVTPK
ncbi:hypothetical protein EHS25_006019 [Saitozyma podzolica]|uniref:Uncharacterized protein n=1 Tax=Saitozyma podzolica TaxID=1890683 RepID=A0A427XU05_9TREE|nr:hypothetical protein EHS25_006019 [Saitozyma podzolica]